MPAQTGTTPTPEPFTGYAAACRSAEVLEEARVVARALPSTGSDTDCQRMSALLAIADQYRALAATMAGPNAAQVLRPPVPDDDSDARRR